MKHWKNYKNHVKSKIKVSEYSLMITSRLININWTRESAWPMPLQGPGHHENFNPAFKLTSLNHQISLQVLRKREMIINWRDETSWLFSERSKIELRKTYK